MNFLNNSTRSFSFKLHNNILGLNSRVSHFVRGHPDSCTFCDIGQIAEHSRESTSHLFFDCNFSETVIQNFYGEIFSGMGRRFVRRSEFFGGFEFENESLNKVLDLLNLLVKKYIWDCKLRFQIPQTVVLKDFVINELRTITSLSGKTRDLLTRSSIFNRNDYLYF